jgi:hypothetical protein
MTLEGGGGGGPISWVEDVVEGVGDVVNDVVGGVGDVLATVDQTVLQPIEHVVEQVPQVIGGALADVDHFVHDTIPGGWATIGAAALMAYGIYDPELLASAEEGTLTTQQLSNAGYNASEVASGVSNAATEAGFTSTSAYDTALSQGFTNATEYANATSAGFTNGAEYANATLNGFTNAAEYNTATGLGFTDAGTFQAATDAGFANAAEYNAASNLGYTNAAEYTAGSNAGFANAAEYNSVMTNGGFSDPGTFNEALSKGFTDANTYNTAMTNGFTNATQYDMATNLGYTNAQDYAAGTLGNFENAAEFQQATDLGYTNASNFSEGQLGGYENAAEWEKASNLGYADNAQYQLGQQLGAENADAMLTELGLTAEQAAELSAGGFSAADLAAGVAAGYFAPAILQMLGLGPKMPDMTIPHQQWMPIPTYNSSGLVNPGENPGMIEPSSFYGPQAPGTDQYYWGQHGYVAGPTGIAGLENYNNNTYGAPATPYGNPNAVNLGRLITPEELGYPNPQSQAAFGGTFNPQPILEQDRYTGINHLNTAPPPVAGYAGAFQPGTNAQMALGQSPTQQLGASLNYVAQPAQLPTVNNSGFTPANQLTSISPDELSAQLTAAANALNPG